MEAVRDQFADYRKRYEAARRQEAEEQAKAQRQGRMNKQIARAQEELDVFNAEIERERKRFREALHVINLLTENKTKAVTIGSSAHQRCMAASAIIKEVEDGAEALKARRRRWEEELERLKE